MKKMLCLALALLLLVPSFGQAAQPPKLNAEKKTLYLGGDITGHYNDTFDFNIKNKPSGAKYKWSVSNSQIGTINEKDGVFVAKGVGKVTVICEITLKDGSTEKLKATITVKANAKSVDVSNAPANGTVYLGETFDYNAVKRSVGDGIATDPMEWIISDAAVGSIDKSGVFKATGLGTAQVTARTYQSTVTKTQGMYTAVSQPVTVRVVMSDAMKEKKLGAIAEETFGVQIPLGEDGAQQAANVFLGDAVSVTNENGKKMRLSGDLAQNKQGSLVITIRRFSEFPEGKNADENNTLERLRNASQCVTIVGFENIGDADVGFLFTVDGRRYQATASAHAKFVVIDIGENADEFEIQKAFMTLQTDEQRLMLLNMLSAKQLKALRLTFGEEIGEDLLSLAAGKGFSRQRGLLAMNIAGTSKIGDIAIGVQGGKTLAVTKIYGQQQQEEQPEDAFCGAVTVSGAAKYEGTLTVSVTNANNTGALTYQWLRGGAAIAGATGAQYTCVAGDIGQAVSCHVTSVTPGGTLASGSVMIGKADGPAAPEFLFEPGSPSAPDASDGMIYGTTSAMEYSSSSDFTSSTRCSDGVTQGVSTGTYYIRYAETATHLPSAPCARTLTIECID